MTLFEMLQNLGAAAAVFALVFGMSLLKRRLRNAFLVIPVQKI